MAEAVAEAAAAAAAAASERPTRVRKRASSTIHTPPGAQAAVNPTGNLSTKAAGHNRSPEAKISREQALLDHVLQLTDGAADPPAARTEQAPPTTTASTQAEVIVPLYHKMFLLLMSPIHTLFHV